MTVHLFTKEQWLPAGRETVFAFFVRRDVRAIFAYRHTMLERIFRPPA